VSFLCTHILMAWVWNLHYVYLYIDDEDYRRQWACNRILYAQLGETYVMRTSYSSFCVAK
jgi:hypothetical protein